MKKWSNAMNDLVLQQAQRFELKPERVQSGLTILTLSIELRLEKDARKETEQKLKEALDKFKRLEAKYEKLLDEITPLELRRS
jgi:hypothetical protein